MTWPAEVERIRAAGFTAMKFRVGPLSGRPRGAAAREDPRRRARRLPDDGRRECRLHVPARDRDGRDPRPPRVHLVRGAGPPARRLPGLRPARRGPRHRARRRRDPRQSRSGAIELLARGGVDIVQPEPVICGGIAETLWIAELAAVHSIPAMPHTSNNAIGIAAAAQILACLPDPNRSPASDELYLEYGVDDNPHRSGLLATPLRFDDGWVDDPRRSGARRRGRRGVPAPPRRRDARRRRRRRAGSA